MKLSYKSTAIDVAVPFPIKEPVVLWGSDS
jgi:hypothetical protein